MITLSMAAAGRVVDAHRYRKDAALALGVPPSLIYRRFPTGRRGSAFTDRTAAEMHRMGLPLDRVMAACGLSAKRVIGAIQKAEEAEIKRIQFAAECAAWRAYTASLPAHQMGA